jgi:hypothetical protein
MCLRFTTQSLILAKLDIYYHFSYCGASFNAKLIWDFVTTAKS